VRRDFTPLNFFFNWLPVCPRLTPQTIFEFRFELAKKFDCSMPHSEGSSHTGILEEIRTYLRAWIRGLMGIVWWKKKSIGDTVSFYLLSAGCSQKKGRNFTGHLILSRAYVFCNLSDSQAPEIMRSWLIVHWLNVEIWSI
jgi:hypothetical protein